MKTAIFSTIIIFAGAAIAGFWAGFENLPDGPYAGKIHPDGSVTVSEAILDDSHPMGFTIGKSYIFELVPEDEPAEAKSIAKRDDPAYCWGGELNHAGVDQATIDLKNWAGGGRDFQGHDYFGFNNGSAYVYYCVLNNSTTNVDRIDIAYGMGVMDAHCRAYEPGYMAWAGNPVEIVGKCRSGTAVCVA